MTIKKNAYNYTYSYIYLYVNSGTSFLLTTMFVKH